jgi:hypothetical protein
MLHPTSNWLVITMGCIVISLSSSGCVRVRGDLDHFLVYNIDPIAVTDERASLQGIFDDTFPTYVVYSLDFFVNPAWKKHNGKRHVRLGKGHHLTWYSIKGQTEPERIIEVENQFGKQKLTLQHVQGMLVPSGKNRRHERFPIPEDLDHYKVYQVTSHSGFDFENLIVGDQFSDRMSAAVSEPIYYAIPTVKEHNGTTYPVQNKKTHIVFYSIDPGSGEEDPPAYLFVHDQFTRAELDILRPQMLGVPTTMISTEETAQHYLAYDVDDIVLNPPVGIHVESRYDVFNCLISQLTHFNNPVAKLRDSLVSEIADVSQHATWYRISEAPSLSPREITVENQFGEQIIVLGQPEYLFVPSGKSVPERNEQYGISVDLNHYVLYNVTTDPTMSVNVTLTDQFVSKMPSLVTGAMYYGVPVIKTHNNEVSPVASPEQDILFYTISPNFDSRVIPLTYAHDQFIPGERSLDHFVPVFLGLPTTARK